MHEINISTTHAAIAGPPLAEWLFTDPSHPTRSATAPVDDLRQPFAHRGPSALPSGARPTHATRDTLELSRPRPTLPPPSGPARHNVAQTPSTSTAKTLALIPAHNEERDIAVAVRSVKHQVNEVVVVADNCSDDTAAIAVSEGASVYTTRGNRAKKAGALNQALEEYLPSLADGDFVILMDADSALCEGWVEKATGHYTPATGGISGAYLPRYERGFVPLLQRIEYAQERRRIARRRGRVDVLSGVATLFSAKVLREVADKRGGVLPGRRGWIYDESSLTEDFEITIALRHMGYHPRAPKECLVETDIMPNWRMLYAQRIRWQRGTLETLNAYPSMRALPLMLIQAWTYLRSFAWPVVIALLSVAAYYNVLSVRSWWLLIIPLIVVEQVVSTWRAGPAARIVAGVLLPVILYDNFRGYVYWASLWKSVRKHTPTWTT